ncbi:DNA polymerase III, beta subunit [Roseibium sp. TrichSKD4]|uniref:DNA polymerase III subunit beta n=1 Tax=Roseibium sp. TrichSKD4 TaxID=744980 RepID=UPI0001E56B4A|nr:DNA polymerase III subunit beta [Roseibium sp. TrichSKD4]EFO30118.1 DNA polymerase III, beta subunit [Roseibium sp. TrichSKD4]
MQTTMPETHTALPAVIPSNEIIIDRADFLRAVTNAKQIADKPKPKEAIGPNHYLYLCSTGGGISATATDFDTVTSTLCKGDAPQDFFVALPAHQLFGLIAKADPSRNVVLACAPGITELTIGAISVDIETPDWSLCDMPVVAFQHKMVTAETEFLIPTHVLRDAFRKTLPSVSTEEVRYYLRGVYLHAYNGKFRAASTDGHRLTIFEDDLPPGVTDIPPIIIPTKGVQEVVRMLSRKGIDASSQVKVIVDEAGVFFQFGDYELLAVKAIDGTFPDYQRLIPAMPVNFVSFEAQKMEDALKALLSIKPEFNRVLCSFEESGIHLSVSTEEGAKSRTSLKANLEGIDPIQIKFNGQFISDLMKLIEGRARVCIDHNNQPVVLQDVSDDRMTYLVMPLKIDG